MDERPPVRQSRHPQDAGHSLVEVMVAMGIMSVLMALFTAAILHAYGTSNKTQAISVARSQLHQAFQRFDKELRYASWIAEPGMVGTTWYVEFASADGTECRQLRLDTAPAPGPGNEPDGHGVLQMIRWTPGTPPAAGTPRQTIASHLVTEGVDPPFERQAAGTSPYASTSPGAVGADFATDFQRLRIRLTARAGSTVAQVDTTFTALNTSRDTPAVNDCSQGRPA